VIPSRVAVVSYRLGGTDGVAVEAAKWVAALRALGIEVTTVAGSGTPDRLVDGMAADAPGPVDRAGLSAALGGAEVVVVENCCSLPLNPRVRDAVAETLAGRPAILRHHDLPWQRPQFQSETVPSDPAWRHVTINERSRIELAARGTEAITLYNSFDPDPPAGDREATRAALGVSENERLLLQPTRAIRRKNVPGGLLLAQAIGATYWLLGPAEDGYGPELERVLGRAATRVIDGISIQIDDAYAASDAVVLPSTWEGFGNPSMESALHRRALAIGNYPVSLELRRYGFSWFDPTDPAPLARFLGDPDPAVLDRNQYVARLRFSSEELPGRLAELLDAMGSSSTGS
jgi:hypothetical protein